MKLVLGWTLSTATGCRVWSHDFVDGHSVHVDRDTVIYANCDAETFWKSNQAGMEDCHVMVRFDMPVVDVAFRLTPYTGQESADIVAEDIITILQEGYKDMGSATDPLSTIAFNLCTKLETGIGNLKDGLSCPREFLNQVALPVHEAMQEADGLICPNATPSCRVVGCRKPEPKTPKPTPFRFKLHFGHDEKVMDEEISRLLSAITDLKDDTDPRTVDVLLDIMATRFYRGGGLENSVIQTMLRMLMTSGELMVAYCHNCEKYVLSRNTSDTVCAIGGHQIFKIEISERDDRQFIGIWGDGYNVPEGKFALVGDMTFEAITSEQGYAGFDIATIDKLEIGESHRTHDQDLHVIVRVK